MGADPAYLYAGHYGYAGYPYAYGYPYGAYYGYRPAAAASHQHVSTAAATYGIHQLHKREAEAAPEADADAAAAYYGGYYGHPGYYGYGYGLGYRGYYGYGYPRYGYYGPHSGKRSADAEPEAEAA